jgi:hypothetical protein
MQRRRVRRRDDGSRRMPSVYCAKNKSFEMLKVPESLTRVELLKKTSGGRAKLKRWRWS